MFGEGVIEEYEMKDNWCVVRPQVISNSISRICTSCNHCTGSHKCMQFYSSQNLSLTLVIGDRGATGRDGD